MNTTAHRRRDVHIFVRPVRRTSRATMRSARLIGLDANGRFIGPNDVDRGFAFFCSRHRRSMDTPDPVFATVGLSRHPAARSLRITAEQLCQLHALSLSTPRGRGYYTALARTTGLALHAVRYHLTPSTAMAAALRDVKVPARAA